jgi:hypothetical protein
MDVATAEDIVLDRPAFKFLASDYDDVDFECGAFDCGMVDAAVVEDISGGASLAGVRRPSVSIICRE